MTPRQYASLLSPFDPAKYAPLYMYGPSIACSVALWRPPLDGVTLQAVFEDSDGLPVTDINTPLLEVIHRGRG